MSDEEDAREVERGMLANMAHVFVSDGYKWTSLCGVPASRSGVDRFYLETPCPRCAEIQKERDG